MILGWISDLCGMKSTTAFKCRWSSVAAQTLYRQITSFSNSILGRVIGIKYYCHYHRIYPHQFTWIVLSTASSSRRGERDHVRELGQEATGRSDSHDYDRHACKNVSQQSTRDKSRLRLRTTFFCSGIFVVHAFLFVLEGLLGCSSPGPTSWTTLRAHILYCIQNVRYHTISYCFSRTSLATHIDQVWAFLSVPAEEEVY